MSLENKETSILHLVSYSGHKYLLSIQNVSGIMLTPGSTMLNKNIQCCSQEGSSLEFSRGNKYIQKKKKVQTYIQVTVRLQILTGN